MDDPDDLTSMMFEDPDNPLYQEPDEELDSGWDEYPGGYDGDPDDLTAADEGKWPRCLDCGHEILGTVPRLCIHCSGTAELVYVTPRRRLSGVPHEVEGDGCFAMDPRKLAELLARRGGCRPPMGAKG